MAFQYYCKHFTLLFYFWHIEICVFAITALLIPIYTIYKYTREESDRSRIWRQTQPETRSFRLHRCKIEWDGMYWRRRTRKKETTHTKTTHECSKHTKVSTPLRSALGRIACIFMFIHVLFTVHQHIPQWIIVSTRKNFQFRSMFVYLSKYSTHVFNF